MSTQLPTFSPLAHSQTVKKALRDLVAAGVMTQVEVEERYLVWEVERAHYRARIRAANRKAREEIIVQEAWR